MKKKMRKLQLNRETLTNLSLSQAEGGFAVVDVVDDEAAKMWAGKIAEACGWPHEVRRFKPQPTTR